MNPIRARFIFIGGILLLSILFIRIIFIQYIVSEPLLERGRQNKIKKTIIEPSRGNIYDRNGVLLVDNRHAYNLYTVPEWLLSKESSIDFLSEVFEVEKDTLVTQLLSRNKRMEYRLFRNIGFDKYSAIVESQKSHYGVTIKNEWRRNSVVKIAPHVLGYLGEVRVHDDISDDDIQVGDLIGKAGVEFTYDHLLRGQKGIKLEIKDARSKKVSNYRPDLWKDPIKGSDLYLTIDSELQLFIEDLLKDKVATCVVLDVNNGEVLAMASKPDYDLDIFADKVSYDTWNSLNNDPRKPLINKAIMAEYSPGSVIKMGNVLAALDQNIVDKKTKVYCPGGMQVGNRFYKCWNHAGHGKVDAIQAIMMSCDTYFYDIATKIDIDKWHDFLYQFGFSEETGIDLPFEREGLLPDKDYYNKRVKGSHLGYYSNIMIGQGEFIVTPIQIALYTAMLANDGKKVKPHLLYKYENTTQDSISEPFIYPEFIPEDTIRFNNRHLSIVRKGMYHVVNTDGGTARRSKSQLITFVGKTGTVQNAHGKDHGWFCAYAPYEKPEISIAIFEEHGEHGSDLAPLARQITEFWFKKKGYF